VRLNPRLPARDGNPRAVSGLQSPPAKEGGAGGGAAARGAFIEAFIEAFIVVRDFKNLRNRRAPGPLIE